MKSDKNVIRTPSYYVKKRLLKNKPAMFGMVVIILVHAVALLGYLIMPDDTPYANDGSALIKKKPMGFEARLLKVRINREIEHVNFFEKIYFGQESEYTILPVDSVFIKGWQVYYKPIEKNFIDSMEL